MGASHNGCIIPSNYLNLFALRYSKRYIHQWNNYCSSNCTGASNVFLYSCIFVTKKVEIFGWKRQPCILHFHSICCLHLIPTVNFWQLSIAKLQCLLLLICWNILMPQFSKNQAIHLVLSFSLLQHACSGWQSCLRFSNLRHLNIPLSIPGTLLRFLPLFNYSRLMIVSC